ncbi:MAG: amidohydrolase [Chloroflexota bacterium]
MQTTPNLIFHNAKIYTVNQEQPWTQAVAIRKHRIIAVGDDADILALADDDTQLIDLGGQLMLPGLCDAHIHFLEWCLSQQDVLLDDCTSRAEMMARIAERSANSADDVWILGKGWNESRWGETEFPTADDIDQVTGPNQPAIFWRSDMHGAVANRAALRAAGITADTPDPEGGVIDRDAQGEPNGILRELALSLIAKHLPEPTVDEIDRAMKMGMAMLHSMGITAIHDQRMKNEDDGPACLAAYQRLRRAKELHLRVNTNVAALNLPNVVALGLHTGFGNDYLRLGHVKVFTDGSLGSRTALMLEPFEKLSSDEEDNYGVYLTPPEQMAQEFRQATESGFPISVHAIGDGANRLCLDIFEELAAAGLQPTIPHRIEHAQTVHPDDLARFRDLDITASVQPIHVTDDMDTADLLLGDRAAHMYNFRTLTDMGVLLALGSDGPVANVNPYLGIHAAVCRQRVERMDQAPWYGDERLTMAETIAGYTLDAAKAAGWNSVIGSIEVGKRADLVVLDRNLFEFENVETQALSGDEIAGTKVVMTVFDGAIVYRG